MKYFFDTSAFVKFYHEEPGSIVVSNIIMNRDNQILLMELLKLEFSSAIYRRFRSKEINELDVESILKMFNEDLELFEVEPFTTEIVNDADRLLSIYGKEYGLRTLDALHLASCYLLADSNLVFVCSDTTLCAVAKHLNISTINPIYDC